MSMKPSNARKRRAAPSADTSSSAVSEASDRFDDDDRGVQVLNRSSSSRGRVRPSNASIRQKDVENDDSEDDDKPAARKINDKATKKRPSQGTAQSSRSISGSAPRDKHSVSSGPSRHDKPRDAKLARTSLSRDVGVAGRSDRDSARKSGTSGSSRTAVASQKATAHTTDDGSEDSDMVVVASTKKQSKSSSTKRDSTSKTKSRPSSTAERSTSGIARPLFRSDDEADEPLTITAVGRAKGNVDATKRSSEVITVDIPDTASSSEDELAAKPSRSKTTTGKTIDKTSRSAPATRDSKVTQKAVERSRWVDDGDRPSQSTASRKEITEKRKDPKTSSGKRVDRTASISKGVSQSSRSSKRDSRGRSAITTSPKQTTRPLLQPESRSPAADSRNDSDAEMNSDSSAAVIVAPRKAARPETATIGAVKPPLSRPADQPISNITSVPGSPPKRTIGSASASGTLSSDLRDLLPRADSTHTYQFNGIPYPIARPGGMIGSMVPPLIVNRVETASLPSTSMRRLDDIPFALSKDIQNQQAQILQESEMQRQQLAEETARIARLREDLAFEKELTIKAREEVNKTHKGFADLRKEMAATQEQLDASYDEVRREARDQQRRRSQLLGREQAAAADREAAQRLLDQQQAALQAERERFRRGMQREHEALAKLRAELEEQQRSQMQADRDSGQDSGIALHQPVEATSASQRTYQKTSKPVFVAPSSDRKGKAVIRASADKHGKLTDLKPDAPKKRRVGVSGRASNRPTSATGRGRLQAADDEESDGLFVTSRHPEPTTSEDEERTRQEEEADRLDFEEATRLYDEEVAANGVMPVVITSHYKQPAPTQNDEQYNIRTSSRNSLTHPDDTSDMNDDEDREAPVSQAKPSSASTLPRVSRSSQESRTSSKKQTNVIAPIPPTEVSGDATQPTDIADVERTIASVEAEFPAMADESEYLDRDVEGSRRSEDVQKKVEEASLVSQKPRGVRKSTTSVRHARHSSSSSPASQPLENGGSSNGLTTKNERDAVEEDDGEQKAHASVTVYLVAARSPPLTVMAFQQRSRSGTVNQTDAHAVASIANRPAHVTETVIEPAAGRDPDFDFRNDASHDVDVYNGNDAHQYPVSQEDIPVPSLSETLPLAIDERPDATAAPRKRRGRHQKVVVVKPESSAKPASRSSKRVRQLNSEDISVTSPSQERQSLSPSIDIRRTQSKSGSPDKQLKPSLHTGRRRESKFQPQKKPRQSLRDRPSDSSAEDEVEVAPSSTIGQPPPRASQAQIEFRRAEAKKLAERTHERVNSNRKHYGRSDSGEKSPEHDQLASDDNEQTAMGGTPHVQDTSDTNATQDQRDAGDQVSTPAAGIVRRQWANGNATLGAKRSEGGNVTESGNDGQAASPDEKEPTPGPSPEVRATPATDDDAMPEAEQALDDLMDTLEQHVDTAAGVHDSDMRDQVEDALADLHEQMPLATPVQELLMQVANEVVASNAVTEEETTTEPAKPSEPEAPLAAIGEPERQPDLPATDGGSDMPMEGIEVVETVKTVLTVTDEDISQQPPAEELETEVAAATETAVKDSPTSRQVRLGAHIVDLGPAATAKDVVVTEDTNQEATAVSPTAKVSDAPSIDGSGVVEDEMAEAPRGVHEESIELEDAVQAAEKASKNGEPSKAGDPPETPSSDSDEGVDDAEGEEDDTSAGAGESQSDVEDPGTTFDRARLVEWANKLTEPEDRSVIGETGVVRLFEEQLSLGLTGLPPLLLAWRLDATDRGRFDKHDYIQLLEDNEIDTPAKLSVWLDKLQANTLAIQQHKRFLSEGSDGGEQQTLTMRVPAEYKKFYRFCFGALREPTGDHMPTSTALKLWEVILAPFFETGADIIKFIQADHDDNSKTSKAEWNALLDFSQQVVLSTKEGAALVGHDTEGREWPGVIGQYITWVAEGRPDALSEMSEAESSAMEE